MSAILAMAMIITVDLCLFGYMSFWNLKLNMLTMVNLLISIGYSVDYTVHIIHTFTHCLASHKNTRMVETLVIMANPLTDGMISTFLPVVMLATANKVALVIFFKMMMMVLLFAYAEGLILLPVLLSLIGPKSTEK
ncbi:patched family protein [Cardiosporidium cionae]|uniref:Patched family protein n=1 Tax=Cardiosporidium cionae TaxID=476202 RepID=A0ABQ7JGJ7_9APIC|nr:patched family protein [Cardiosporidium cionae]|eukprot:KAF8823004.1 patched family protein [Cardiosporidium cionae]